MHSSLFFPKAAWLHYFIFVCVISVGAVGGHVTGTHFYNQQQSRLADAAAEQLTRRLTNTSLFAAVEGIASLSTDPTLIDTTTGRLEIDNPNSVQILQISRLIFQSDIVYLLNNQGDVVACTPYGKEHKETLTGKNYSYRAYFNRALETSDEVVYLALGVTTLKRGIYISKRVTAGDKAVGVLVVKMGLDSIDRALEEMEEPNALYNQDGVIVASNRADWIYKTFTPISPQRLEELHTSKQFGDAPLAPLGFTLSNRMIRTKNSHLYAASLPSNIQGWNLVVLKPEADEYRPIIWGLTLAGGIIISLVFTTATSALEQTRAKNLLKEKSKRLELALEGGQLGTWDWHIPTGKVIFDERWAEMKGYNLSEVEPSYTFGENLIHPDDLPFVYQKLQAHLDKRTEQYEATFRMRHKGGQWIWILDRGKVVEWNSKNQPIHACGTHLDITEQKNLEYEIRREHEKFFSILDTAPVGIIIIDSRKTIRWVNDFALQFAGLQTKEELLGQQCSDYICPEEISSCPVLDLHQHIKSAEQIFRNYQGAEYPIIKTIKQIDYEGETCLLEIFIDITDQKKLERELLQAQKLESVGRLAAGVAHEINTPIQYIGTNIEFIAQSVKDITQFLNDLTEKANTHLNLSQEEIHQLYEQYDIEFLLDELPPSISQSADGVENIGSIVQAMKRFSHPGDKKKAPTDLNDIIATALIVSTSEWKHIATISTELGPGLDKVPLISDQIGQVILNIVINAAHAIQTAQQDKDNSEQGYIVIKTAVEEGFAVVRISDNGCGIPPKHLEKIFDFFFTTKEVGKGTGQGLALSYDVITNKHGGQIDVDSQLGVGSTFTLKLPLAVI